MKKIVFIIIYILINHSFLFSQEIGEENMKVYSRNSYSKLLETYQTFRQKGNLTNAKIVAKSYLLKAKKEQTIEELANAYYMLLYTSYSEEAIKYADSIIAITKNNINFKQPALAHIVKATYFGTYGLYKEAFIQLEKAHNSASISGNTEQVYGVKYMIARLKSDVGDYESSLNILKTNNEYYNTISSKSKYYLRNYVLSLYATTNNFNFLKQPDSSKKIIKKAIPLSLKLNDSLIYDRLLLSSAIASYQKGKYTSSMDSIIKIDKINKNSNTSTLLLKHLYKGKNYLKQRKKELAINSFKTVDSISLSTNYYHPLVKENYQLLINFYKEKNDFKNQLFYLNRLLKADSIIDKNYAYLVKNTNERYTIPNLISEKQKIISSLEKKDFNKKAIVFVLFLFSILTSILLYRNNKKKKTYKKYIQELNNKKKSQSYSVDDETTKRILKQLSRIENSTLFLNSDFSLSVLAKMLDTNTSYLSKIINEHKQKTFKQYLIDLRMNALLNNLDKNPMMRKYSIEALAQSIGYTNASSFTRIFKNYIGESPSSFLKKRFPKT